ncbi:SDH family Clp fold serine proteinase [Candidatus Spongiihabitans sp.]|uniref:SDH family Clp fold serine proteinase n=1 Tax=Candidatus Spongiihabitans sp. TaxID=3101308 RepID=UPI003C7E7915
MAEEESIRPALEPTSLDQISRNWLKYRLNVIEEETKKDVLAILGPIEYGVDIPVRIALERLPPSKKALLVILDTPGGLVEVVQRIVKTLRNFYEVVHFVIPNRARSAGTVLAMSGDAIYMDYFSCLGPIDPQIPSGDRMVSALSYRRQYDRLVKKSANTGLAAAEFALLDKLDLAQLDQIELAAELSKSLIQEWLSTYKFKDWVKDGVSVEPRIKQQRAEEIANKLNDHERWYSHGHGIHKDVLERDLKLKIDDYSNNPNFRDIIWQYFWPSREYCIQNQFTLVQTRSYP